MTIRERSYLENTFQALFIGSVCGMGVAVLPLTLPWMRFFLLPCIGFLAVLAVGFIVRAEHQS